MHRRPFVGAVALVVVSSACGADTEHHNADGDAAAQLDANTGGDGDGDTTVPPDAAMQGDGDGDGDTSPPTDASLADDATLDTSDSATDAATNPPPSFNGPLRVYVGGFGSEITVFEIDPETLAFSPTGGVSGVDGPSFLAFDAAHRFLVAVSESGDRIESYAIAPGSGDLMPIDSQPSGGEGPTHLTIDATGHWVLVAHYDSGTVTVLPLRGDGSLGPVVTTISPGMNAHQVVLDARNAIAYVPCLGSDYIAILDFDASTGALSERAPAMAAAGAGPRHFALSEGGTLAWMIAEQASTITYYSVAADGALTPRGTVSTLPDDFTGGNSTAEIAVHPSGKWLYGSNRGHDSIAVFQVAADGAPTRIANTATEGDSPRHFSLLPSGNALLVANQSSNTITGFHIDPRTGLLTSAGPLASFGSASFVAAIQLP